MLDEWFVIQTGSQGKSGKHLLESALYIYSKPLMNNQLQIIQYFYSYPNR